MSITLKAIKIAEHLPHVGNIGEVDWLKPSDRWGGWVVRLRGPLVYLVSPRGWTTGIKPHLFNAKGPRLVLQFPVSAVRIVFDAAEDLDTDKMGKYDSAPVPMPVSGEVAA